jgi:hypothetical protein
LLEIDTQPWTYPAQVNDRPCVSAMVRMQAKEGSRVTSLRHQAVEMDEEEARRLLILLNGERDRTALLRDSGLDDETLDAFLKKLLALSLLSA